jgi:hypothetical protein
MDWAHTFPERARALIAQSGVRGARLLPARLRALADLLGDFERDVYTRADDENGFRALHHPRVRVAVDKLVRELRAAERQARRAERV